MSSGGTVATLGGYFCLGRHAIAWDLVDGVKPNRQVFELLASDAEALMAEQTGFSDPQNPGDGVELVWQIAGGPEMTAEKLYPIHLAPSDIPQTLMVVVVDIRHWWFYQHISRAYNVRRRIGTQRLTQDGGPLEIQPLAPAVAFFPFTLHNFEAGSPIAWTPREALIDIMDVVTGGSDRYRIEVNLTRDLPIEGLQIDDDGQSAVRRILAFMSGAAVFVDYDGTAWIRDSRDGREALIVDALPALAGGPLPVQVSHRLTRPRKVRCLITRRLELRVDSPVEVSTSEESQQTQSAIETDVRLTTHNVAAVPDATLRMTDGRLVVSGNWQKTTDLFAAWALDMQPGQLYPITADVIRETWLVPGLLQALVQGLGVDASSVLSRRLAEARGSFRSTWQLDQRLLDRLSSIEAARVGILDYQSRTRAPSRAYLDWTALYAVRGPNRPGQDSLRMMDVFTGYPGANVALGLGTPGPFAVTMEDAEQGVFRITPRMDPTGAVLSYIPGRLTGPDGGAVPSADPRQGQAGGNHTILKQDAQLATGFAVATVLTVIAGAPNTEARFHVEEVTPAMVEKAIGRSLGPCDGPAIDIRIGVDLVAANTAWQDDPSVSGAIKGAIGLSPFGDPTTLPIQNSDDVRNAALAAACQVYMGEIDRVEGGIVGAINPGIRPIGSVSRVSHGLAPNGQATTTVAFPTEPPHVDLMAFMDEKVRRRLLGLVDKKSVVQ